MVVCRRMQTISIFNEPFFENNAASIFENVSLIVERKGHCRPESEIHHVELCKKNGREEPVWYSAEMAKYDSFPKMYPQALDACG